MFHAATSSQCLALWTFPFDRFIYVPSKFETVEFRNSLRTESRFRQRTVVCTFYCPAPHTQVCAILSDVPVRDSTVTIDVPVRFEIIHHIVPVMFVCFPDEALGIQALEQALVHFTTCVLIFGILPKDLIAYPPDI
jgi:hypothetical protein